MLKNVIDQDRNITYVDLKLIDRVLFVFFFVVTKPTRSKLPIRSQEKHSRAISPSPYESPLPSQKRTKSSTNIHENEPVLPGASQYVFLPSFIGSIDQSFLFLKLKNCS